MNKKKALTAIVLLMFVLSACAKTASEAPAAYYDESKSYDNGLATSSTEADAFMTSEESPSPAIASGTSDVPIQQMIIMNANLTIAVDDPGLTMSDIGKMAKEMGGFVVSSYIYKTQTSAGIEVPEASTTIRVPADDLEEALDKIKAMTGDASKYTLTENISGQDVTQEYTDLASRLRNLEEADAKLSELYDSAEKTEDALAIYSQKMQVTEQIEVIKGQMQYYEQSSSMSAITVTIVAKETIAPITVAGWQPQGVVRDALQGLINFGKGFVEFLIWLIILIVPILLVIGAPIFFLVRWLVRRNRRKEAERQEALRKAMESQQPPYIKK